MKQSRLFATLMLMSIPAISARTASAQAGGATGTSTAQSDAESLAFARSIIATMFPPERRQATIDKMMVALLGQMRTGMQLDSVTDPGLKQIMNDYLDGVPQMLRPATSAFLPKQMEAMAKAYTRAFSPAELKDIDTFAQTPSGRDYLQRSIDLLSDPGVAAVNAAYFRDAAPIVQQGAAQLRTKIAAYIQAHPEAAPKAPPPLK